MDMQPTPDNTPTDAEFATFLVESQDDALMKELNAEKLLRIKDAITAGLNAFEVPYIVDASDTLNVPQVDALFETILTNLSEENGFIDHEKAESTLDSTILKQSATEHALYAKISLYNTAFSEQSSLEQTTL